MPAHVGCGPSLGSLGTRRLAPGRRSLPSFVVTRTAYGNTVDRLPFDSRDRCSTPNAVQDTVPAPTDTSTSIDSFPRGEWSLHKFGGTCVSDAERIEQAGDILVKVRPVRHSTYRTCVNMGRICISEEFIYFLELLQLRQVLSVPDGCRNCQLSAQ